MSQSNATAGPSSQRNGSSSPVPGKAGRLQRSRKACTACHATKQRCDGPAICPCHRCVTFGLECVFPSQSGPTPSRSALPTKVAPVPNSRPRTLAVATNGSLDGANKDLAQQLQAMTARLASIESTLLQAQITFPPLDRSPSDSLNVTSPLAPVPPFSSHLHAFSHAAGGSNPVETAGEAMAVEGLVQFARGGATPLEGVDTVYRPDIIERGIMSVSECEAEFNLYFEKIQPWAMFLSTTLDRDPLVVRERSPLLFHSILLLTIYYRPRTATNIMLYRSLLQIHDSILAPQILCPQPDQLSSDFVRALHLLLLYKPLQLSSLAARGVNDLSQIEHASKMNVRASWMLRGLVSRVSTFIGLPSITTRFAHAFANQHATPIPDELISEQRLFFGLVFHETHGALQSGKPSNSTPHDDALLTTRHFATLRRQPSDVRLAASVELVSTTTAFLSRKEGDRVDPADLERFDVAMDAWHAYWMPILEAETDDELRYSTLFPYQCFVRVVINGFAFTRWRAEKKERRGVGPTSLLTAADRESIAKAVRAAEAMVLALTVEAKVLAHGEVQGSPWDGVGRQLTLNEDVVRNLRWASDSLTCVLYYYSLVMLAKLANAGILGANLSISSASSTPTTLSPLGHEDRLCRLLELGATFLEAVAPNSYHPAITQAAFLRRIRDAAINGRSSVISVPGTPHTHETSFSHSQALSGHFFPTNDYTASAPSPDPAGAPDVAAFSTSDADLFFGVDVNWAVGMGGFLDLETVTTPLFHASGL